MLLPGRRKAARYAGELVLRSHPVLQRFLVFNTDQCDGPPEKFYPQLGAQTEEIADCETVTSGYLSARGARALPMTAAAARSTGPATTRSPVPAA